MHTPAHVHRSRAGAFTLVELLVSMLVLTLLVLLCSQLVGSAAETINRSGKHMDSDTEARLIFNRMAVDLAAMVKRGDVDYSSFKQPAGTLGTQYNSTAITPNPQGGNPATNGTGATAANDGMAFYSETNGYFSGSDVPSGTQKAPVSLVAYMVDNDPVTKLPSLRRLGKGLGWDPQTGGSWGSLGLLPLTLIGQWPDLFNSAQQGGGNVDPDYQTVGSQVVRFEYNYLLKPNLSDPSLNPYPGILSLTPYWSTTNNMASSQTASHTSINGFKDVAAIVVAVALLDTTSRATVPSAANYITLTAALPDATERNDIAQAWTTAINNYNPSFATTAIIPQAAASGLHVYERYFYLSTASQ